MTRWCWGSGARVTLNGADERDQTARCSTCGRLLKVRINNTPDEQGYKHATIPRHKEKETNEVNT